MCAWRSSHLVEAVEYLFVAAVPPVGVRVLDDGAEEGDGELRIVRLVGREGLVRLMQNREPLANSELIPGTGWMIFLRLARALDVGRVQLEVIWIVPLGKRTRERDMQAALKMPSVLLVDGDASEHGDGAGPVCTRLIEVEQVQGDTQKERCSQARSRHRDAVLTLERNRNAVLPAADREV
jgi:hypothetical protein